MPKQLRFHNVTPSRISTPARIDNPRTISQSPLPIPQLPVAARVITPVKESTSQFWCGTNFNFDPTEKYEEGSGHYVFKNDKQEHEWVFYEDPKKMTTKYMITNIETCPDTKKPHQHIYCVFLERVGIISYLKKIMPTTHWEPRLGTHTVAKHYVQKPDINCHCKHCKEVVENFPDPPYGVIRSWEETGDDSDISDGKGTRTDWKHATKILEQEQDDYPLIEHGFGGIYYQYPKACEKILARMQKPRDPNIPVQVVVYWGKPGTNKSRLAFKNFPDAHRQSCANMKWWDRYKGHKQVVLEDFRGHYCKSSDLLVLFDRYPRTEEQKGIKGGIQMVVDTWIITSNKHPSTWYTNQEWNDDNPLRRRISSIIEVQMPPNQVVSVPVEYLYDHFTESLIAKSTGLPVQHHTVFNFGKEEMPIIPSASPKKRKQEPIVEKPVPVPKKLIPIQELSVFQGLDPFLQNFLNPVASPAKIIVEPLSDDTEEEYDFEDNRPPSPPPKQVIVNGKVLLEGDITEFGEAIRGEDIGTESDIDPNEKQEGDDSEDSFIDSE